MKKSLPKLIMAGCLAMGIAAAGPVLAADSTNNNTQASSSMDSNTPVIARLANKLDLSDKQRQDIKTIVQKAEAKAIKINDSMMKSREQLGQMLNDNKYDEDKVEDLAEKQGDGVADIIELQAKMQHDILQVLTPEQRSELKKMIEEAQQRLDKLRAAAAEAQAQQQ